MAEENNFTKQATEILKILQDLLNQDDEEVFKQKLQNICNKFIQFYQNYYQINIDARIELQKHKDSIKALKEDPDLNSEYIEQKHAFTSTIQSTIVSLVNGARQLETILTGFKTVFLKTLNQNFIQQIVIEAGDDQQGYEPIIIQLNNFSAMSNFIASSTLDFQGRLKSNKELFQSIDKKQHNDLYRKIWIQRPYIEIYKESRRRLNVFYDKIKKGYRYGEALLLYKPKQRWIKFYVTTLGDVKEGFAAMVAAQATIKHNKELDIQTFAEEYIGKVDNITGALVQDIQNINNQIAIKSGSAQTGSHQQLIKIIKAVADGDFETIRKAFESDETKISTNSGQRNRIYNNKESKEKIATMIKMQSEKKAKQAIKITTEDLHQANNVLIQVQKNL